MTPEKFELAIPELERWLVFSAPLYLAASMEETPYQLLQLCDAARKCETLSDLRGIGGLSMSSHASLALSRDRHYLLTLRMTGVVEETRSYRSHYFEIYNLKEGCRASFAASEGRSATTDNIIGWSRTHPHALEISVGWQKKSLASPTDGRVATNI